MNGSRSSPPRRGDRSSLDALSRTIEGLEARIEDLMGSPAPASREPRRPAERERETGRDERRPQRAGGSSVQNALEEIRQRQRALEAGETPQRRAEPPVSRAERYEERPVQRQPRDYRMEAPEPRARATAAAPSYRDGAPRDGMGMQDIAQALVNLRHELKQDISAGVSREIGGLLDEMRMIKSMAGDRRHAEDMRGDLARLAEGIGQLGRQARPDDAESLRAEFEDLRSMMDNLAREDSMRRMETRWDGMEERLQSFNTETLQDELVSLAYRLDDIKSQLGSMSDIPAIRTLEDRMMTIASTLDDLGKRIEPRNEAVAEQFAGLDRRLDEISRAIAATPRNAAPAMDPVFLQRLENRIGALAGQIEDIGAAANRPDPTAALNGRLETLAARIEDLASERAASHLEERLDTLSALLANSQKSTATPELTHTLSDISRKIDALDHGLVNDVLAERLDYLARRIDEIEPHAQPAPVFDDSAIRRLENQIGGIAARLDETASAPAGDERALAGLEAQIANLSRLISEPQASLPPEFDSRMTAIEDYIATSDEYIVEAARQAAEAVLEGFMRNGGTSQAAAPADLSAFTALAEDLRHLEDLTRNSEERTHRTFEALHDTLVQIAGRLEHIETVRHAPEPAPVAKPAPAFAFTGDTRPAKPEPAYEVPVLEAEEDDFFAATSTRTVTAGASAAETFSGPIIRDANTKQEERAATVRPPEMPAPAQPAKTLKKSLLGGLTSRFMAKSRQSAAAFENGRTVIDPIPPIAPDDASAIEPSDELLEPGSGVPDVKKILQRVRASQEKAGEADEAGRTDYITAARRAAQAAARELEPQKSQKTRAGKTAPATSGAQDEQGSALARYRRPLLLAVGAVLLVVMSLPLVNTLLNGQSVPPVADNTSRPVIEEKAETGDATQAPLPALAPEQDVAQQPAPISPAPAQPVETVPLAAAGNAGRQAAPSTFEPVASTAAAEISVPAEIQPPALAEAARSGDAQALFEIGARYTEGRDGVAANLEEAAVWYKLAADKGLAPAEYRLANLYEKGTGIGQDIPRAMDYYRKAASQGNASAMHNLAVLHASGNAGEPDMEAAANWFQKAADLGVSDSQFNLAILFARGSGVARNLEESYKWFAIAAKGGDKDAAQKRDEVANALKPEQLENARARVELWKAQPLDSGANEAVVPDAWTGKALKTASVDMKKAVRNIQAILNNNGYDAGAPDGEMGPKTVSAIKAFQKSIGQEPTGKINDALVKELLARNK